ncbi:heme ABC transporter substrate-binding protein IsdE [Paenibacillus sp. VTT E-133280]|uniref:heme ABC transporter substrate-binding protein IsdE n=1 Tax=Paenibacillus sp. VTT E-133280 TaxID=1986222 RepID=UPI000BA020F3|nr:heme ABC transporter substrate-binding protein IsdE [Paenibacillus sp. VTT E-133280]OZQ60228.1 heme ABC transporter substrate-binding protein IsdE [Paenibacillus sp. VTT E-133280]
MRRMIGLMAALCWIIMLAGCVGNTERTEQKVSATAAATEQQGSTAVEPEPTAQEEPRIISTTVSATEIMALLDLTLVGIPTSAKILPDRYADVETVGNPMSPDMEKVKSLKPTEVLSVTTLKYDLKPLFDSAGIKTNFLDLTSLAKLEDSVAQLGKKYDRKEQADSVIARYEDKITEVQAAITGKPSPKVLILLGVPGSYLVATEHSYIGDLVRIAGGINIVQGETVEYLASNTEYLQQANPDVILRAAHGMPEEVIKMFNEDFIKNDIWKHFNAVKNDRVYDLPEELFGTTANLAADAALDDLLPMLYPELQQ